MYLIGKIKDIKRLKNPTKYKWFNPPKYTWIENSAWLENIPPNQILVVSTKITGLYKKELGYLIDSGKIHHVQYFNEKVESAIKSYSRLTKITSIP